MVDTVQLSLKGEDPAWGGLVDLSQLAPTAGMFNTMRGCVIGKDGSEIETFPGSVLAAKPRYMDKVPFSAQPGFVKLQSNLGVILQSLGGPNLGHGLQKGITVTVHLSLQILLTNLKVGFIDRSYSAFVSSPSTLTIDVINSADPDPVTWSSILPDTSHVWCPTGQAGVPELHGLKWVNGQIAVVGVSERWSETPPVEVNEAVATWRAAGVDWTATDSEDPWEYWPNPVNFSLMEKDIDFFRATTTDTLRDKAHLEHYPPRRKCNLHVTNDDLVIAVPGQGVVLQANLSAVGTPLHDSAQYTRLLGVPKGGLFTLEAVATLPVTIKRLKFADTDFFWVAIGYRDRITGQVGLTGSPQKVTMTATEPYAHLRICAPRFMLNEAWGMEVIVYSSGKNGGEFGPFYPILAKMIDRGRKANFASPFASPSGFDFYVGDGLLDQDSVSWDQKPLSPILEQYPVGSTWAVSVRGVTFYGGGISHKQLLISARGLGIEQLGFEPYDLRGVLNQFPVDNNFPQIRPYHLGDDRAGNWGGQLAAGYRVPSSYQGTEVYVPIQDVAKNEDAGWEIRKVRLNLQEHDSNADVSGRGFPWSLDDMHFIDKGNVGKSKSLDVLLNRGQVQFSELGRPGITPSINRIIFDRIKGIDTRAAGRLRDSVVICTEKETYRVSWGRSPQGSDPVLLSDTYGCISPNSMVEFPGGLAWLSKVGPVVCDGAGVHWIGVSINENWKTFKRDSEGMMWQAFGVYDKENLRIIWGLRQDLHVHSTTLSTGSTLTSSQTTLQAASIANNATVLTDDEFATVPNDTLLIYNHQSRAFSTHEVALGRGIVDMERMPDENGAWRMFTLEENGNVYQLDNRFMDHRDQTREFTVLAAASNSASEVTIGLQLELGADNSIPKETRCMLRRDGEVIWRGDLLVDAIATTVLIVILNTPENEALEVQVGDVFVSDIVEFDLETTFKSFGQFDMETTVNSLIVLSSTERNYPLDIVGATLPIYQFAEVTVVNPTGDEYRVGSFWGQPIGDDHRTVFETGWGAFSLSRLKITVFGNAFTKLKDLVLNLSKAG